MVSNTMHLSYLTPFFGMIPFAGQLTADDRNRIGAVYRERPSDVVCHVRNLILMTWLILLTANCSLTLLISITVYTIYFHPQHTVPTASEKDNMVIRYLTLNIISIKTVSSIAVSLTLGDYWFLYTIYHIQVYTLPLPLNPIKIGIFVHIHHTVLC